MKRLLLPLSIFACGALFLGATQVVSAQTATQQTEQTTTQTQETKLADRLKQRKEALKTKLTAAAETRLKAKCKAAQGKVAAVGTRANTSLDKRYDRYDSIVSKLNTLVDKLKARDADTAKLETLITQLEAKIETFKESGDTYRQSVTDLKDLDCVADPEAFKATLDITRSQRADLLKQATDIKALIKQIRDELTVIRKVLASEANSATNDGGVQ